MTSSSAGQEHRFTIRDYPKILVKRVWILVAVFVLGVGAVTVLTLKAEKTFRATATVQIRDPRTMGKVAGAGATVVYQDLDSQKYYETQYQILKQPSTIRRMVQTKIMGPEDEPIDEFKELRGLTEDQIVKGIVGRVDVVVRRGTEIVDISVDGKNPKVLHKLANALVETFMARQSTTLRDMRQTRIRDYETKALDAKLKMEREQEELTRFLHQHDKEPTMFERQFDAIQKSREVYTERLQETRLQLIDLEPTLEAVQGMIDEHPDDWVERLSNDPYVLRSDRIVRIDTDILEKRAELSELRKTRDVADLKVTDVQGEIQSLEAVRRLEVERLLLAVPDAVKRLKVTEEGVLARLEEVEQEYTKFADLKVRFEEFNRRIDHHRELSERYYRWLDEMVTGEQFYEETVKLVEKATEPTIPVSPKVGLNIGLAAMISLLMGFGLAVLLEHVDDTLMSKEEVARLGDDIPHLGVIRNIKPTAPSVRAGSAKPVAVSQQRDLFVVEQPKSTVAEDFRGVRTALSFGEGFDDARIFLVTSTSPKEGKTTVTINLSSVMASSDMKTLLIDADLRKPRVHRSFGISNEVGLTSLIIGRGSPTDCIRSPQIEGLENLDVLTSGAIPPNPSELLGRPALREILYELGAQYDRILIDSPPLGAVTDAAVLGRIVDRTILVVKAGKTKRRFIENSIEQLRRVNAKFAGVILNDLRSTATRYYPGYYQYYYYRSTYGTDDPRKKKGA
jgi:capsular exopolysaccharide synthesis family protein